MAGNSNNKTTLEDLARLAGLSEARSPLSLVESSTGTRLYLCAVLL